MVGRDNVENVEHPNGSGEKEHIECTEHWWNVHEIDEINHGDAQPRGQVNDYRDECMHHASGKNANNEPNVDQTNRNGWRLFMEKFVQSFLFSMNRQLLNCAVIVFEKGG